ncbi:MAG: helix-turn-helix domain-containing protein [Geminicoccaceae bacterium]
MVHERSRHPRVSSTSWALADLVCCDLAFSPIAYRRPQGKGAGHLLLRLYGEGRAYGRLGEATFRSRPGEIHLFDQALACRGVTTDRHRQRSVFIPYSAVQYEPGRHPAHLRVDAESAVGRVLRSAIEALFAELPRTRQAEAAALAAGFAGLVKGLLLSAAPLASASREFDTTRRLAMRRYLEEHLVDPELGAASLCAAFGASRATTYRDFADEGGIARFVTRRRLERAFRDLAGGPPDRGRVRRVAERWGFVCPYHFSRAFRQQFDLWPSEVFEAHWSAGRAPSARANAVVGRSDDGAPGALTVVGASADA